MGGGIVKFHSISVSSNNVLKAKISGFFTCFFCLTLLELECSRNRKTTSFLTSHRLKNYKNLHPWRASRMEQKRGKCWKSPIFEGKLWVFISYLSEMKIVSMLYNSSLFYLFLQLVSTIFLLWRYLNSSMTRFLSDILLPFPNPNDLNSHVLSWTKYGNNRQWIGYEIPKNILNCQKISKQSKDKHNYWPVFAVQYWLLLVI